MLRQGDAQRMACQVERGHASCRGGLFEMRKDLAMTFGASMQAKIVRLPPQRAQPSIPIPIPGPRGASRDSG
jgi:hypothetical protein